MTEADKIGLPTLRRISQVSTAIDPQSILANSNFNLANATLCNAIPRTKAELELGGFSTLEAKSWEKFYNQVDVLSEGKFNSILKTKNELKRRDYKRRKRYSSDCSTFRWNVLIYRRRADLNYGYK